MNADTPPESESDASSAQPTYAFDIPLAEVESAPIKGFDAYWRGKPKDGRLPSREDIDPAEIVPLLPDLVLLNVEWEPFRCRVRLRGTRAEQFRPVEKTTKYLDELATSNVWSAAASLRQYQIAATEGRPVFSFDWMVGKFGVRHPFQTGIWPLASDGRTVDLCIAVEDYLKLRPADMQPSAVLQAH